MELAILILLVCILLLLIFYGFYFTKKINGIYTDVHNTIVSYMDTYNKHLSYSTDNLHKAFNVLSSKFSNCVGIITNQHCNFTNKAIEESENYYFTNKAIMKVIEKSENYHHKAIKIVLESLKVFSDDLDEFTEHVDKSIKEINCNKKKSNSKEIKVE